MTWDITEDFEYVVTPQPQETICFGSCLPRDTMPLEGKGLSPFMRRMANEIRRNIAPGSYDVNVGALHDLQIRPISRKGLGARAERFPEVYLPSQPQIDAYIAPIKKNRFPFNSCTKRKSVFEPLESFPSPSDIYPKLGRREMKFAYSFNGKKILRCAVHIKCVPYNLDVCDVCGISCSEHGDYWLYQNRLALCRPHYDQLYNNFVAKYKGVLLRLFKPYRDCYFAHEHNSCRAALKIMTSHEILKKLRKEAYLDAYYPQRRFLS